MIIVVAEFFFSAFKRHMVQFYEATVRREFLMYSWFECFPLNLHIPDGS